MIAWAITKLIYSLLNKNKKVKFCKLVLDFNIVNCFVKSKNQTENAVESEENTGEKE